MKRTAARPQILADSAYPQLRTFTASQVWTRPVYRYPTRYRSRLATDALPRSEEKIHVMMLRLEAGEPLFHPDDAKPDDEHQPSEYVEFGRTGKPFRGSIRDPWEDKRLLELLGHGLTYREVGKELGRTREACRSRYRKLQS